MSLNTSATNCCTTTLSISLPTTVSSSSLSASDQYQLNDFVQRGIVAFLLSMISILGIVGNILVLLAILLCRKLQTQTNVFVVNLCVADLLTSLSLPFQAAAVVADDVSGLFVFSNEFCAMVTMLEITCLGCSVLTLTMIAVNRFVLITRSKSTCNKLFSPVVLAIMLVTSWLIPAAEFGVPVLQGFISLGYYPKFRVCAWHEMFPLSKYLIGLTFIFALSITLTCYFKIYLFLRWHAKSVANLGPPVSGRNQSNVSMDELPSGMGDIAVEIGQPTALAYRSKGLNNASVVLEDTSYQDDDVRSTVPRVRKGSTANVENGDTTNSVDHIVSKKRTRGNSRTMEAQISKNLFVVVCAFVLSLVPFATCLAVSSCLTPFIYTLVGFCMGSCINPIIYGFKHPHFRPVFACIILCRLADIPQPSRLARKIASHA